MKKKIKSDEMKDTIRKIEAIIEIVVLSVEYYFLWKYFYHSEHFPHYTESGKYILMFVYAVLVLIVFYLCDCFKFGHLKFTDIALGQLFSILIVNTITYFNLCLIVARLIPVYPMIILSGMELVICAGLCYFFTFIYHNVYPPQSMVMIYGTEKAVDLKFKMDQRDDKYSINTIIRYDENINKILEAIDRHDAVIINDVPAQVRNDILKYCFGKGKRTYAVPKISDIITRGAHDITLFDTPLLLVRNRGLSPAQRLVKRVFDIILSLIALVAASPVMLVTAIAIKAEDGGPVFYRQERVTIDGKRFNIMKFRSMIVDAEKQGLSVPATGNDPRITRVGRIIRATRIDELPQIINILMGQMSIVGPRPERTEHVLKYMQEVPEFGYRLKVKGGLTGYAQIFGKYNTSAYDKLRLDLVYIENYSLLLDLKLIFMTVRILFKKESTEGFDAREELEKKRKEALTERPEDNNENKD